MPSAYWLSLAIRALRRSATASERWIAFSADPPLRLRSQAWTCAYSGVVSNMGPSLVVLFSVLRESMCCAGTPAEAGVPVHSGIVYGAKTATHQHPHAGFPTGVFAWSGMMLGSIRP